MYFPPPDGSPATSAQSTEFAGGFIVDGGTLLSPEYLGLAPQMIGVDQVNLQIPAGTRDGCAVPLAVVTGELLISSPTVSISIHSSRGQCVDPPVQSYGTITLEKTITSGGGQNSEVDTIGAAFPSGPGLTRPAARQSPTMGYIGNDLQINPSPRLCSVAGYSELSVGAIDVSGPGGSITLAQPTQSGSAYSAGAPAGFVNGGVYTISAAGTASVGSIQTQVNLDQPIQITSVSVPNGTSEPLTVTWTGGSSASVVKVSLVDTNSADQVVDEDYGYAVVGAGSFSFQPVCEGDPVSEGGSGVVCSFGLPEFNQVVVEQVPASGQVPMFAATGITSGVQISWDYRFVFLL